VRICLHDNQYINNLLLRFCGAEDLRAALPELASHPLELYRMSMLQGHPCDKVINCGQDTIREAEGIENAVDLRESGVHFKSNEKKSTNQNLRQNLSLSLSLTGINFDPRKGCLQLPALDVNDGTEHLLRNMLAYEQIHVGVGNEITSYIMFMDELINTKDDVKLLQKNNIIHNLLGSHEAVADLFNSLTKEATHDPCRDTLNRVKHQLNQYCKKTRNKWMAHLRHQHLQRPWGAVSVTAASLVILLTLLQTIYSILSFHLGK